MTLEENINFEDFVTEYSDISPLVLSSQIRYNNRIRIKDEDLAQHSYYVAYNIMKIGHEFEIEEDVIQKAVCRAIVHDLDEQFTSDIPHDCKVQFPQLKEMVREIGLEFIKERASFATKYFLEYSNANDLCNLLVDMGDAISVLQYVTREIELGNKTEDMHIIHLEIKDRLKILLKKLQKYKEEL